METEGKELILQSLFFSLVSLESTLLIKVMKISSIRLQKQYKYLIQSIFPKLHHIEVPYRLPIYYNTIKLKSMDLKHT